MELPAEVLIHNELLGMKGSRGMLLQVSSHGYYELNCRFGEKSHRVLLPISSTILIHREPEPTPVEGLEIERYGE